MFDSVTKETLNRWLGRPLGKSVVVGVIVLLVSGVFGSAFLNALAAGGAYLGFEWVKEMIVKLFSKTQN